MTQKDGRHPTFLPASCPLAFPPSVALHSSCCMVASHPFISYRAVVISLVIQFLLAKKKKKKIGCFLTSVVFSACIVAEREPLD